MLLKLGTRRSLLAWAQSTIIARELERLTPELRVELVGIETRGDKILDISLQNVQGKEFFVAELDDALKSGKVDLTVHSMKDLSLDRPSEFVCAAIPKRENPRDVILFGPQAIEKLKRHETLKIGTSSPRRLENIPGFLSKALPRFGGEPKVELVEIRGNVNTRLGRVHEPPNSPKSLDGVVLAFAGLIRLWKDPNESGREELGRLLRGVRWMILPLRECPTAPAQGALAIECRTDHEEARKIIEQLNDSETVQQVGEERGLLAEWGGGCHQRFGATVVRSKQAGPLLYIRGAKPDGSYVDELRWNRPEKPAPDRKVWDGLVHSSGSDDLSSEARVMLKGQPLFIAHSRALPKHWDARLGDSRVWTSGVSSWYRLAERDIWVEGCAEGLGFEEVISTLEEPVLQLPPAYDWVIFTHESAAGGWSFGRAVATYRLRSGWGEEARSAIQKATHIFWGSGAQFTELRSLAPRNAHMACGPGKTANQIQEAGLNPVIFPSVEEWRKWLESK